MTDNLLAAAGMMASKYAGDLDKGMMTWQHSDEQERLLQSIARRFKRIDKDIKSLNLTPLLHGSNLHLVNEQDKKEHPTNDQIVLTIDADLWDTIEW